MVETSVSVLKARCKDLTSSSRLDGTRSALLRTMMTAHGLLTLFGLGFAAILGSVPGFALGYWLRGAGRAP
jgi:hypothetical protein